MGLTVLQWKFRTKGQSVKNDAAFAHMKITVKSDVFTNLVTDMYSRLIAYRHTANLNLFENLKKSEC